MDSLLDTAIRAARTAGDIIRSGWGQVHTVTLKSVANPVTEIDHAAEAAIIQILRAATPNYGILTEETGAIAGAENARWLIDPLDGTVNYAHHFPYFSVSVALEREGQVVLGVVFEPLLGQLFVAERRGGAWLDGQPIHVSTTPVLADSLIATGFPYDVSETGRNLDEFARMTRAAQTMRIFGSAAIDMAYIACGRIDAYVDSGLGLWDVAVGRLLIEEAGGVVSFHGGTSEAFGSQLMIAANAHIHPALKSLLLDDPGNGAQG